MQHRPRVPWPDVAVRRERRHANGPIVQHGLVVAQPAVQVGLASEERIIVHQCHLKTEHQQEH